MATGISLTHYTERKLLDQLLRGASPGFTFPAGGLYVGLFTATPGDQGGGTEVSGGGYARQQLAWTAAADNGAATGAQSLPAADLAFPAATAAWGTIAAIGLFDTALGGNLIAYGSLAAAKTIGSGDQFRLQAIGTSFGMD